MNAYSQIILRTAAGLIGATCAYCACFMYENEEKGLQNRLEDWWLRLTDNGTNAIGRHSAVVVNLANLSTRVYTKVFGQKLWSFQSLGVSICLAVSSIATSFVLSNLVESWIDRNGVLFATAWAVVFLTLAFLPMKFKRVGVWLPVLAPICGALLLSILVSPFNWVKERGFGESLLLWFAVIVTVPCDWAFVAATRWLHSRLKIAVSNWSLFGLVALNVAMVFGFVVGPWMLDIQMDVPFEPEETFVISTPIGRLQLRSTGSSLSMGPFVAAANGLIGLLGVAYLICWIPLGIHQVFWFVAQRAIYAVQRLRPLEHRKKLASLGAVLIAFALGTDLLVFKMLRASSLL